MSSPETPEENALALVEWATKLRKENESKGLGAVQNGDLALLLARLTGSIENLSTKLDQMGPMPPTL